MEGIDEEAKQTLKLNLAARRLVDFSGPHGWETSSINLGRGDRTESICAPVSRQGGGACRR